MCVNFLPRARALKISSCAVSTTRAISIYNPRARRAAISQRNGRRLRNQPFDTTNNRRVYKKDNIKREQPARSDRYSVIIASEGKPALSLSVCKAAVASIDRGETVSTSFLTGRDRGMHLHFCTLFVYIYKGCGKTKPSRDRSI